VLLSNSGKMHSNEYTSKKVLSSWVVYCLAWEYPSGMIQLMTQAA